MKLTNAIRLSLIVSAIARSVIPKRREEFKKRHKAYGQMVYATVVRPQIPPLLANAWVRTDQRQEINAWVFTAADFSFNGLDNTDHYRHYNDHEGLAGSYPDVIDVAFEFDDPVLVPRGSAVIDVSKHPALVDEGNKLVAYHQKTNAIERKLREQLRTVLWAAASTNKLLELWPQAKDFLPSNVTTDGSLIPTEAVADINKMLNSESEE